MPRPGSLCRGPKRAKDSLDGPTVLVRERRDSGVRERRDSGGREWCLPRVRRGLARHYITSQRGRPIAAA